MSYFKKAQTATEYLIILAVVIIIALIVVGVLGGIPGIGGSTDSSVGLAYWKTSTIGVAGFKASISDNDAIIFRNNLADTITIDHVRFGDQIIKTDDLVITIPAGKTYTYESRSLEGDTTAYYSWNFKTCLPASSYYYTDDFADVGVANYNAVAGTTASATDTFAETLIVEYTNTKTGATYTFTGAQKLSGTCSV